MYGRESPNVGHSLSDTDINDTGFALDLSGSTFEQAVIFGKFPSRRYYPYHKPHIRYSQSISMRLLDITTPNEPKLVYFADGETMPRYAILSHVWEDVEVSFQHMQDPYSIMDIKGHSKIVRACEQARSDSVDYIWIDTCCIDKTSSSELSEAINSMYRYYREAAVC
jgi:hypothetical protein